MGAFDSLFGKKITVRIPNDKGEIVERKISKRLFGELEAQGIIKEIDAVQAHILDPLKGYYVSNWIVGEDIDRESAMEFATESKDIYVATAYENGEPRTVVMKKEVWEKQKEIFEMIGKGQDYKPELESLLSEVKEKIEEEEND
jgi:diphthamide synthase (EF-2-diphthine--ammonia ligase)